MANNQPYDLQALMDRINTLVSNDSDTPTSSTDSDEWNTRLYLIYQAIGTWEDQDVLWNELWKTYTHGSTLSATTTYALSSLTDYRFMGGYVRLTLNGATSYIKVISPKQAREYIDASERAAYITGNDNAGYTLNLTWTPASSDGTFGATVVFDYYKRALKPSATTDEVEMSSPGYIIFWVAAQKALLEGQRNKYSVYDALAVEALDNMRIFNDLLPDYQNNRVQDTDALHGAVLGE